MTPSGPPPSRLTPASRGRPPADRSDGPGAAFVLAMTAVGAILRGSALTRQSLWVDELLTWQAIQPGPGHHFFESLLATIQGPLYQAAMWPLLYQPNTALTLRLPAAVAGVLAIPLFALLAGRLLDRCGARLALLLFALNPFHIWYSQEGRGYAFLVLFAILAGIFYLRLIRGDPKVWPALGFGLAGAGMLLSNLSGVFLLAAMGFSVLTLHRADSARAWGAWIVAFGLMLVITMPWLLQSSGVWAVERLVPGADTGVPLRGETFTPLAVPYAFYTFFFGFSLGPSLRELHAPDRMAIVLGYWPVIVLAGAAAGTSVLLGALRRRRESLLLVVWIVVPVALLVALVVRNVKPWNARYLAVVLPWLLLLAGAGLARLRRRGAIAVAGLLFGLTLWSLGGYYGREKYVKADVRAAVAHVAETPPPTPVVLVPTVTNVFAHYDRGRHELLPRDRPPLANRRDADQFVGATLQGYDFCRVVLAREWFFDPGGHLVPALARAGRVSLEAEFPGVRVLTWQRGPDRADAASPDG
jgi:hypothetical protein